MSVISSEDRQRFARPICDHLLAVHPSASPQAVETFVCRFLRNETPEDLAEKIQFGLPMHLAKFWAMLQQREPDKPQIEAYVHKIPQGNVSFNRTVIHILQRDMPFLVDSTLAVLQRFGKKIQYFTECDFTVLRDGKNGLVDIPLQGEFLDSEQREILLRFEIRGHTPEAELCAIREAIYGVLHDVDLVVKDWLPMRGQVENAIKELGYLPPSDEVPEVAEFLSWLDDHHFTFLGYREFPRDEQGWGKNCLGLFRKDEWLKIIDLSKLEAHHDAFLQSSDLIWFNQTKEPATVHRPIPMDVIAVKLINSSGQVIGVRQFLGLSASVSYNRSPRDIPILRLRVRRLLLRSGYSPHGYTGRLLIQVLEHFPRDELFQSSENFLFLIVTTVLRLGTHQKVALFVRRDPFGQFLSCLVYVAKDLYSARLREVFGDILAQSFGAEIKSAQSHVSDFAFARLHFILATDSTQVFDSEAITRKLEEASLSWSDRLQTLLTSHFGEEVVQPLVPRYIQAFPISYQERFAGAVVIADIENVEKCLQEGLQTLVYSDGDEAGQRRLHIKLYNPNAPIPLAVILPILKNLDFNVAKDTTYRIAPKGQPSLVWIQDLEPMERAAYSGPLSQHVQQRFQEALAKVWGGEVESDGFNRLLLRTGLTIWQIQLLRAYCKFLKQIGFNLSQSFMEETLSLYPQIAEDLVSLFEVKFDPNLPACKRELECTRFKQRLEEAFESIATLDQDRIIRKFYNLICVTVRTNAYQREGDGGRKPYLSFKFHSGLIEELPAPRPYYEIFVYSARMEAVHLRGGKVSRGGIRWSDRREDFRTEVLGLLKAQMVKNAVIVPVGSKGGFVVKNLPADPQAQRAEVITCYAMMMRGLLDITDNMSGGENIPPPDVVAYDDADPYLVVAADKGTATFSDIANDLSQQYGFWLGDAFASGGSSGYDHKKMGITARGAWESTRRHFRELSMNPDVDSFTVAGVGDLSGDIFGNGMLLSRKASLIAAFNHQHIFIDPSPDLEKSFAERKRMFALPTSTWCDYDSEAISSGGGVFSRSEKWIAVSPEMAAVLDISADVSRIQPNELIHHILRARVDLMWFGGIGTFVKAGYETHMDVGDRTNDALRVNANEMRCRVVVEGANLGMTQEARIQCALMGVKINTDALDNSAGVSCSDHEVNIKILLSGVMQRGLLTLAQRNELLASMTDAVADLVLRDNYLQNSILSLKMNHVAQSLENHALLIKRLEDEGILDRVQSNLPNESALAERMANQQGLTRPELAVLVAHTKIWIYNHLLASSFLDEQALELDLLSYFPSALQEAYGEDILNHPLRREILATVIANNVVNRFGGSIVSRLDITTGVGVVNVVSAIYRVSRIFSLEKLWRDLEKLDELVQPQQQIELLEELNKSVEKAILWCIQHVSAQVAVVDMQEKFGENLELLMASFGQSLSARDGKAFETQVRGLIQQNVTEPIARRVVKLIMLADSVFDIIETAIDVGYSVQETMKVYFYLSDTLGLRWARETLDQLALQNTWQKLSRSLLSADLLTHQRTLVHKILKVETSSKKTRLESWLRNNAEAVDRVTMLVREMQLSTDIGLANIDILSRSLANLAA